MAEALVADRVPTEDVLATARAAIEAYPVGATGLGDAAEPMLDTARTNLDTTEAILALSGEKERSPLERSVGTATEVTTHHARLLGVPTPSQVDSTEPDHQRPSAALADLASVTGTQLTVQQHAELAELDELPEPVADALTDLVDAHLAMKAATEKALSTVASVPQAKSLAEAMTPLAERPGGAAASQAVAEVLAARTEVLAASVALQTALGAVPDGALDGLAPVHAPPALAIDLAGSDDTYEEDVSLLVDAGGDDTYRNNAGGSGVAVGCQAPIPDADILPPSPPSPSDLRSPRAGVLLDLDGEDRYVGQADCGSNGGGHWGSGLLVDDGGQDVYHAGERGTNGGGHGVGFGLLVDTTGDDRYQAGDEGTNGGGDSAFGLTGQLGLGLLLDGGGDDTYDAGESGTNGGGWSSQSAGALVDLGDGHDTYRADRFSTNGGGWLGQGFLVDTGGDDTYDAGDAMTVGVNGGAQLGLGFLFDEAGNDTYLAAAEFSVTAENGGANGGLGFLLDGAGDDTYDAEGSGANGGVTGGLGGLAVLADGEGNDTYIAHHGFTGTNGGVDAQFGAMAVLADMEGDDTYRAESAAGNGAVDRDGNAGVPGAPNIGLLFDGEGRDRYEDPRVDCVDCSRIPKGLVGTQVDV